MIVLMGYIHVEPCDIREFVCDLDEMAAAARTERGREVSLT